MAFENLTEQFKDLFESLRSRITESESFNSLKESYNNLPLKQQKILNLILGLVVLFLLINIPLQSYWTSKSEITTYKTQKDVLQRLHLADQMSKRADFVPRRFSISELESDLISRVTSFQILNTQLKVSPNDSDKTGLPPKVGTEGFSVQFTNLNVRQISKVASLLENYSDSILLTGLKSTPSSQDPHYFNTDFYLINFYLNESDSSPNGESINPRFNRDR